MNITNNIDNTRRNFLKLSSISLLSMSPILKAQDIIYPHDNIMFNIGNVPNHIIKNDIVKKLSLTNLTTGENLNVVYYEKGIYLPDALHQINYLYRDHHNNDIHPIDVSLLDQLYDLQNKLNSNKKIQIVCGYRSPITNARMRQNSHGVAKNSLHIEGRAIDIRIEGINPKHIKNAALEMAKGGVGYYPESNFVHLDTGDIRTW